MSDAHAKAQVKGTIQCIGYYACDNCTLGGDRRGRVTYLETDVELRTDELFRQVRQKQHHNGVSPVEQLHTDMTDCLPIDNMHQVCLGVIKRLLLMWIREKGSQEHRLMDK